MSILVKNVHAADCRREHNRLDVRIQDGVVAELGQNLSGAEQVINGEGLSLLPAFTDLHAHFREPGLTHKEDILSGCRAAVAGGYVNVSLMANTKPIVSSMELVRQVQEKAKAAGLCHIHQCLSITENFDGKTLAHLQKADPTVVRWLSDDGVGVADTAVLLEAMQIARRLGVGLMLHEEDPALTHVDMYLAEDVMTTRDVRLAKKTGCPTHFCHVSTKQSLAAIAEGKKHFAGITCEVTPHHLALNDSTPYNVAPPLRSEEHRQAVIEAIVSGVADAIATDHAPHTQEDKAAGANGMVGLESAFAVCYTHLVKAGLISLPRLMELMSHNPARLLGREGGIIEVGQPADLVLAELHTPFVFQVQHTRSKGKNTPFAGHTLFGTIQKTMRQGEFVYEAN